MKYHSCSCKREVDSNCYKRAEGSSRELGQIEPTLLKKSTTSTSTKE